jgi:predicted RNase H-like nuclease
MATAKAKGWTPADEEALKTAMHRRAEHFAARREVLKRVVDEFHHRQMNTDELVDALAENAAAVTDALVPFVPVSE